MTATQFPDNFKADLTDVTVELGRIDNLAQGVSHTLSAAFRGAILDGKSLKNVLADVARAFTDIALKAAFKPMDDLVSGVIGNLFKATDPSVKTFAKGGVIATPSYFPLGNGLGLAGEAGREAILPLTRGNDGSLGVASSGGGSMHITFNVTTPDARSFATSEAEVGAMLLRAVRRGTRAS